MGLLPKMPFWGLWFQLSHKLELQNPMNFKWICKILASKINSKSQEKGGLDQGSIQRIVIFSI